MTIVPSNSLKFYSICIEIDILACAKQGIGIEGVKNMDHQIKPPLVQ